MDWIKTLADLRARGMTQAEIAWACGTRQTTISDIAGGRTKDPSYSIGRAIERLAAEHKKRPAKPARRSAATEATAEAGHA